ncbi:MAG: integrase core domain-containing protein, partial [Pseudomonadota bacterium]
SGTGTHGEEEEAQTHSACRAPGARRADGAEPELVAGLRGRCANRRQEAQGAHDRDDFTRECLAIEVDTSLPASRVVAVLERLRDLRGLPSSITVDHGPEFGGRVLDAWAYQSGVDLAFIRPGKPVDNCYIESFNGRFRDECLNEHWFITMAHARSVIEAWRIEYNTERTHSSLRDLTPEEFRDAHASEVKRFGSVSVKTKNPVSLTPDSTSIPY